MDAEHERLDGLFDLDTLKLNFLRQARKRILDARLGEQKVVVSIASAPTSDI